MRPVLSAAQMRAFDSSAIEAGVPGIVLMENAGRGAAHLIGLKARPRKQGAPPRSSFALSGSCVRCADERSLVGLEFLILCGSGNNGGDGFVVARHLRARGASVRVWCVAPPDELTGDALIASSALLAVGVPLLPVPAQDEWPAAFSRADLVVDALLGTGLSRPVQGLFRRLIVALNASLARVVALDVPSGLDATSGCCHDVVVQAAHTVTFGHLKQGLLTTAGHQSAGTITVSHIGVPATLAPQLEPTAWLLELSDIRCRLSQRPATAHKGKNGRVVVVAGSPGTVGAARMTAHACFRGGAGVVTIATHAAAMARLESSAREVMTHPLGQDEASEQLLTCADALAVGPGLGTDADALFLARLALSHHRPTVLDADGLRLLAASGGSLLDERDGTAPLVLTPHPGEAADLLDCSTKEIEADRFGAADALSTRYDAVVILKGSRPLVAAPNRAPTVSAFGSAALGTAGSGDVLAGLLAALLVGAESSEKAFACAELALGLQGLAAERWSETRGDRGLLASEIADLVPEVTAELLSES